MSLSELCLDCGLCCDGTLFRHVRISSAERQQLEVLGIATGQKKQQDVMWLPCGKLEGKCCSIYEQRPGGCQRFVCALGQRLEHKEIDFADAKRLVEEMQARLAFLQSVFSSPNGEPVLRYARACIDATDKQVSVEQLEAFHRVEELRYTVFMPPPE